MLRRREQGYCEVSTKGGAWHLPREQYAQVRAAWLKGAPACDATDFFGAALTFSFKDVDAVVDVPPTAVIARLEECRADAADDSLTGAD